MNTDSCVPAFLIHLIELPLFVPRESQTHSNGVYEIVADQSGSDCHGKLRARGGDQPMLIDGSIAAGVRGVPPAVDETRGDRKRDEKCEPAVRCVEESFRLALPTGNRQADQAESASTTHANQAESKR